MGILAMILLDTHVLIWALEDSKRLPRTVASAIPARSPHRRFNCTVELNPPAFDQKSHTANVKRRRRSGRGRLGCFDHAPESVVVLEAEVCDQFLAFQMA